MASANSKKISAEELSPNPAHAAIEVHPKPNEEKRPALDPISNVRRLDVDAVLDRSVRKVVSES